MKKSFILALVFTLVAVVVQAQKNEYSFKETYPVSSSPEVSLYTADGNIEVYPSKNNKVEVYYIARRRNKLLKLSKAELEKKFEFIVNHSKNKLEIKIKGRKRVHIGFINNPINVHLEVYTPTKTSCNLRSSDGDIVLEGLSGDQQLRTSDGDIMFARIKGDITGKTSDGNITFNNVSGSLDIASSDGDIKGNVVKLKSSLKIKTSDGNIRVAIPKKQGLDLDIRGESLRIPLENFSGKSTNKRINGKLNGGGKLVQMRTSDGRITIEM